MPKQCLSSFVSFERTSVSASACKSRQSGSNRRPADYKSAESLREVLFLLGNDIHAVT